MIRLEEEFKRLKEKFEEIRNIGWIKSSRKGPTGIGKTFEDLLGKTEDEFNLPDYYGIEIKTKRFNTEQPFGLFCAEPDGKELFESERLRLKYGYPSKNFPQFLIFNNTFYSTKETKIGNYKFSLKIDREQKILFLIIKDLKNNVVDMDTCWSFNLLQEYLERKLKYLAVIKAKSKYENNYEYFNYSNMTFYKNVVFEQFINLLEKGKIFVNFKIGVYTGEYRYGSPHNHGTSFNIYENNLKYLYENHCVGCDNLGPRYKKTVKNYDSN